MSRIVRGDGRIQEPGALMAPELMPSANLFPGTIGYGTMGYQGASWSALRGYVYWPTMDPRKEIDTWSRLEIARKAHWCCANLGLARRIRQGITNLIVGTGLIPHGTTSDQEWNDLAEKAYRTRGNSALSYSVNGRHTLPQSQRMMVSTGLTDGDAAVLFAESQSGGALRQFYSGCQIGNPAMSLSQSVTAGSYDDDQDKWQDGIQYDSLDRAMTYCFPQGDGTHIEVDAANVRFLYRCEQPGQRRGMSIFGHAVNKLVDITELNTFFMQGQKSAAQIGYYLTNNADEKRMGMGANLGDPTRKPGEIAGEPKQGITLKQIWGQGGVIPSLPKGFDIKTLLDQRPHPNVKEFVEDFIRDISWGSGISADLLWNIYKLGGANVRYILADAQVFISAMQQELVDSWLAQDWVWTIAKEMKAGRLRRCKDPVWWAHGWIPPARVTVDYNRDGRVLLEFHKYGLMTTTRFFGMQGLTAKKEITQELELISWRKKEMERLQLTPLDLQLYNPLIPRIPPEQAGEEDYGEQVPQDTARTKPAPDDDFDESTKQERLREDLREIIREELQEISIR